MPDNATAATIAVGRRGVLTRSAVSTLRYFRRGHDLNPELFYLVDDRTPRRRINALVRAGYLENCRMPGASDLYRITPTGLSAVAKAL